MLNGVGLGDGDGEAVGVCGCVGIGCNVGLGGSVGIGVGVDVGVVLVVGEAAGDVAVVVGTCAYPTLTKKKHTIKESHTKTFFKPLTLRTMH